MSPGFVRTDLPEASGLTDPYDGNPYLEPQDVADAVVYALGTPPHVQVSLNTSDLTLLNNFNILCTVHYVQ